VRVNQQIAVASREFVEDKGWIRVQDLTSRNFLGHVQQEFLVVRLSLQDIP
jgi:hypothetical protein